MKKNPLIIVLFVFLAACSGHAPVATMMPTASLSATLNPTETATSTATATATAIATATATPVDWGTLTDVQRHQVAPDIYTTSEGTVLTESNTSIVNLDLIIYRDSTGNAIKAFDGKNYLNIPAEAGIIEPVGEPHHRNHCLRFKGRRAFYQVLRLRHVQGQ